MAWFLQRNPSPLASLAAGLVAVGLAVAVLRSVREQDPAAITGDEAVQAGKSVRVSNGVSFATLNGEASTNALPTTGIEAEGLVPIGITHPEGVGGHGVHRAVLKGGVWFPVFSPGTALGADGSAALAPRAAVPLSITTGSPPHGKTGVPFAYVFEAIGGTPPYRWSMRLGASAGAWEMEPRSGALSGASEVAFRCSLDVFVHDQAGAEDSAHYDLVIADESALAVVSAQLPAADMGTPYAARLEAAGGQPPYLWAVAGLDAVGLQVTPNTGELGGEPQETGEFPLHVTVTDQTQTTATKAFVLTVASGGLNIVTTGLPEASVGTPYTTQLVGAGGAPPYVWAWDAHTLPGLMLDANTGAVSGTLTTAGQFEIEATLSDSEGHTATRQVALTVVNGLDITTTSPLFPASPGLPYQLTFAAEGGEAPYRWSAPSGSLPAGWILSTEGVLTGTAPPAESAFRFRIEVMDTAERVSAKTFDLAVRQGLIAVPSREKVGLAWRPEHLAAALRGSGTALVAVAVVRGVDGFPQRPVDGTVVYQGLGNNSVDRGLPTGSTAFYTLFAQTADGQVLPFATAMARILPMTLQRAQPGLAGDPFADRVVAFQPLRKGGYGALFVPGNITGTPDGKGTYAPAHLDTEVASLHAKAGAGGSVTLEFTDNIVELGSGADFTVFENVFFEGGDANQRFMEPAIVWVALFEDQWYRFPIDVVPPATGTPVDLKTLKDPLYYNKGFAGRNATTGSDPTNPYTSGGDSFDANELAIPGLTWIRYLKLQATGDNAMLDDVNGDPVRHTALQGALSGGASSGFDLDAVSAVHY